MRDVSRSMVPATFVLMQLYSGAPMSNGMFIFRWKRPAMYSKRFHMAWSGLVL